MTRAPPNLPRAQMRYDLRWADTLVRELAKWFQRNWEGETIVRGLLIGLSGRRLNLRVVTTATYTILLTDDLVDVNRAGVVTLTLPEGPGNGQRFLVQDSSGNASANPITINQSASIQVNGGASVTINTNYGRMLIIYNGTQYVAA